LQIQAQNRIDIQASAGLIFSRTGFGQNGCLKNSAAYGISPDLSLHLLLPGKDQLEFGARLYNLRARLPYNEGLAYKSGDFELHATSIMYHLIYHKKISRDGKTFLSAGISGGTAWLRKRSFQYSDSLIDLDVSFSNGLRYALVAGCKRQLNVAHRSISIGLMYTRGVSEFFEAVVTDKHSDARRRYTHMGTGLHLSVAYFLRGRD
jgi:hypothetical protein